MLAADDPQAEYWLVMAAYQQSLRSARRPGERTRAVIGHHYACQRAEANARGCVYRIVSGHKKPSC